ncbi:intermembrane lipid transfer protein VPS13 isoform X6 [Magnolia sinica]|uniref:intermembrane lipid transfer protein VPS13 isoform X6 n=1 Tax=Magnolia sinica TaxID=86752 RepID=UPI00265AA10D|nr:intermembrane lipid transfer protein VPS13 isoform X6 [Magnolia sinica]
MFEGLVRQLLAGYLGRYIKDIQKDQLKIGLWNEEVLLENVELILEAFEYLQLPFALTQGRVGKLSIKIPWKKLGWDPIIIVLEDVFVCACPRDDHEWSLESVERREFAGKKAKLAAAELAKLSRRVCDNQAGQSFLSYISAKILDGIQVSIRNVHVIYTDNRNVSAQLIFGIRFSSLTIMTDSRPKQNSAGSCSGKLRGGQVNKIVEILSLGIYCNTFEEASNSLDIGNADGSQLCCDPHIVIDRSDYILAPFDVTVSLVVNKSGNLENGAAHYNITAELTAMVVLLNEIQLQRILSLSDYLTICSLREKYGRYRPWHSPLSRKLDGWQRMWWRYAQQAILLDVRRKLRKTSWSNLARRISYRRKYVNLYKTKLEAIRQEQPVNEDILEELEQMEKESEIDDILSYRSVAECELQEHLLNSTSPTTICIDAPPENQQNDERSASRPRGWLNWLSLGMLGAGGTDDSSQFSGVISDEIVKDIYEATKFQPVNSSNGVTAVEQKLYFSAIHLSIHQIIATLRSKKDDRETVRVTFDGVSIECKLWEDSMTILSLINSVEMVDVCTENVILVTRKAVLEESSSKLGRPFISTEIKMSPLNHDLELSIKVVLEPFAVTYDSNFLLDLLDFYHVLRSIQFHHERVFLSLNGFEDFKVRLLSKAEYIFSNRMKITWDICLSNFTVKLPWRDEHSELLVMAFDLGALLFKSIPEGDTLISGMEYHYDYLVTNFLSSTSTEDASLGIKLQDLYDHFMIDLTDFEVNILVPSSLRVISVIERFNSSVTFGSCMLPDESMLKQLKWSSNGPIVEILQRNLLADFNQTASSTEVSVAGDLQVNYNNIHKVMWEPFMEPWKFQFNMVRKHEQNALLNLYVVTDIHLKSTAQLNLNVTEPLIEAIFRGTEMIKDAWSQIGVHHPPGSQGTLGSLASENVSRRRYAPYILQNDTSMPLLFWVSCGPASVDDTDIMAMKEGNIVQPGSSVPIYIDETPEEQIFPHRPSNSSERLNEKKSSGMAHHMISVQLDGTSRPSIPMSMDLVGLSYFEVDFSKPSYTIEIEKDDDASRYIRKTKERYGANPKSGFVVPVVFEVSMQRYSKLIRLHSTVILFNATSMPLELRFDIPFGVSPKVLDPIYPGQEFPLPVHLAEAGRMRWRPLGTNYLWSEAHPLSNILLQENRLGFLRSFVCYPSHPSSDPFRCCISIQDISLVSSTSGRQSAKKSSQMQNPDKRLMHIVRLTTPLLVKSYIPKQLSLRIESGGITHSTFLSEVDTAAVFHIDSTHDLGIMFHMEGFKPTISKFPRAETFTTMAKLSESKFSLCETLTFYPDVSNGPICVTVEKVMDAFCGARELCISIPFLLYNCTGLPLTISDCGNENKGSAYPIPSCYNLVGLEKLLARKQGLALVSFDQDSSSTLPNFKKIVNLSSKKHTISLRENSSLHSHGFLKNQIPSYNSSTHFCGDLENHDLTFGKAPFRSSMNGGSSGSQSNLSEKVGNGLSSLENEESRKARAFMYSPCNFPASELMVRLSTYLSEHESQNIPSSMWSSSFFLVQPGGSTSVIIPQPRTAGAFIISITSSLVAGALAGKTRAITFQPRYVISNACSKELCYKQKGTNISSCLGVGQHSHLHWTDTTRELLVCLRFNEPGWQWSGSFLPDHLGDAQVKMHNYVSGASNMVRVEVQNADVSVKDEKIVGSSSGNSGTYLILLSDDNSGFMPYRIDNFSMERLRIYQQKCERFETTVHPYTCRPYAWDEPCYPHRLVLEVPGERVIGSYSLDDVREHIPVYLSSTSEKPERRLFLSIRAEGATKVLSIIDSNYHILKDVKESVFPGFKEKKKLDQRTETHVDFSERVTVHVSFIGISLIDSSPQELVYICARDTQIDVLQSLDRQKISFQMSLLQIDNQLRNTPYPVILSFDEKLKSESVGHTACKSTCEPIFCLAAAKWRNKESSLVSFEYVNIRLAPLRIELEEQVLLSLLNFVRTVTLRLQSGSLQSEMQTMDGMGAVKERLAYGHDYDPMRKSNSGRLHSLKVFKFSENNKSSPSLPTVVPIGAPWQQIFLLARRQKKIYVEIFDLAPIKLTVSFSSTPWMLRNEGRMAAESLVHVGSTAVQRGLMALVDVEGAPVYLKQLTITHHLASWESIQEILIKHYTRQLLHEMYKVFGSAGVIGNPMGFARNVGLGLKDFLSVPAKGVLQSPTGLITGMAQGTKSLLSNTVYAVSNAATQFSKAAHKGILAFTFDEQTVSKMKKRQDGLDSHSKGVLNEFLEGLTGLLQSPIRGAEKHGLPGVLSGIALGTAGVVARPIASILEVTGKTAQSIRNRSSPHQSNRFRIRFPRPLARDVPLLPYCWEEAIGTLMLLEADDSKLKDEICIMCKALKQPGKFVIITERVVLVFQCSSLVGFGSPEFAGVSDPQWVIEAQLGLEGVVHIDREEEVVNVVGGCIETLSRPQQLKRSSQRIRWLGPTTSVPLIQMSIELSSQEDAEDVSQALRSTIERGKEQCWGVRVLHRSNLRVK